jgi:pilus assembly protein FimV
LKQFFVEEHPNEEDKTKEEIAPELLKSEKAFDTLLALAKTYISMEDFESARFSLSEVYEHGTQKQKDEASSLLELIKKS